MNKPTHTIMKHGLAKALIEAGVHHFAGGGIVGALGDILGTSNDYQAINPQIDKRNYNPQIDTLQGRQNDVYGQQQNLAQSLLAQSQGEGPNPAQAMLNQKTGQNVAQQGALMASQRGASANPALLARQAAQQGAQIQQQSVGQAASLQAQQQLQAQNALAQQQQAMVNAALQGESIQQGGLASQNSAITSGQLGASQINANVAAQNQQANSGLMGGLLGAAGSVLGMFHDGGVVPKKMAMGGLMGIENYATPGATQIAAFNPSFSGLGAGLAALGKGLPSKPQDHVYNLSDDEKLQDRMSMDALLGTDNKESMVPASNTQGLNNLGMMAAQGGSVPGQAEVKGNSEDNDVVPALLSPGEVVLPRSVTQAPDMEERALEFLKHIKSNKRKGYEDVAQARKMACGGRVRR